MYSARQYKGKKLEKQVIVRRFGMGEETVPYDNMISSHLITFGQSKLLEWLLFIDDPESEFAKMAERKNEVIGRARDMLKTLSKDEKLQEEYTVREKAIMDKYSALSVAEERGIEKGIVKGERNKVIEASKKMIQDGISLEFISKYEGLSISELEQIKRGCQVLCVKSRSLN